MKSKMHNKMYLVKWFAQTKKLASAMHTKIIEKHDSTFFLEFLSLERVCSLLSVTQSGGF